MAKAASKKKNSCLIVLKFKEETSKSAAFGAQLCMVLKLGHFGN
jgi:hypothetical protein